MLLILILEDNVIEQARLTEQLRVAGYQRTLCVSNVKEAKEVIQRKKPDLLIANIFLQQGTSFDFVYGQSIPAIFITSVKDVEVFISVKNKHLFPYLVKPIETCTLLSVIHLLLPAAAGGAESHTELQEGYFIVRQGKGQHRINHSDILYLQSEGNYTHLNTETRKFIIKKSLRQTVAEIKSNFIRTHKQYSVNINYISRVEQTKLMINEQVIPLSKRFRPLFMKEFLQRNQKAEL